MKIIKCARVGIRTWVPLEEPACVAEDEPLDYPVADDAKAFLKQKVRVTSHHTSIIEGMKCNKSMQLNSHVNTCYSIPLPIEVINRLRGGRVPCNGCGDVNI
jgi:hypothetical protein